MAGKDAQSIKKLIHNKKEAKKKQYTKGQSPIVQSDNSTIGEGITSSIKQQAERQKPIGQQAEGQLDNRAEQDAKRRTRNQIKNEEIDELLSQLITEGLISEKYTGYYAKVCHTIGISSFNRLVVNSRNGEQPAKLLAYKTKGAMTLHFKRQYLNS